MAAVIDSEGLRGKAAASQGTSGKGDDMDDVMRRLDVLESSVSTLRDEVSDIRADVRAIKTLLPNLATKADVSELRAEMNKTFGDLRAEMNKGFGDMNKVLGDLRWSMVIGFVGTGLTAAGVAVTLAKVVH